MSQDPYLIQLGTRLAEGAQTLDPARKKLHRDFLIARRQPDGGFVGREGDSDLYYTSFAVRTLAMLGLFTAEESASLAGYLKTFDWQRLGVIDLMNWLWMALAVQAAGGEDLLADAPTDWIERLAEKLEAVRTKDGGYAKSNEGAVGSTYHSFLTVLTHQLIGREIPRPGALVQFLYDRQRDDGGFVEIAPMRRSGTNPTAAACAILQILGAMDDEIRDDVRAFLREVRGDDGGLQANTRIPFSDSLSTFTGLLTAQDLELEGVLDPSAVRAFIEGQLEFPTGGFRAALWDETADIEYTFYGLGVLALLARET